MADQPITHDEEVWKPVVGFEGLYEISSFGRLRSRDRQAKSRYPTGRFLRGRVMKMSVQDGYHRVTLVKSSGAAASLFVHGLVCEAFHGPRPEGHQVAHANGVRTDNKAENLRWATAQENGADRVKHGTAPRGELHGKSKLSEQNVIDIRAGLQAGDRKVHLARRFSVSMRLIRLIETGKAWAWLE